MPNTSTEFTHERLPKKSAVEHTYLGEQRFYIPCEPDQKLPLRAVLHLALIGDVFEIPLNNDTKDSYYEHIADRVLRLEIESEEWQYYYDRFANRTSTTWKSKGIANHFSDEVAFSVATDAIRWVEKNILTDREHEMRDEVIFTKDPIQLLRTLMLATHDLKTATNENEIQTKKTLIYEVVRKFELWEVARNVLVYASSVESEENVAHFISQLSEKVWHGGVGVTKSTRIASFHNPKNFSCTGFQILEPNEELRPPHEKIYYKLHRYGIRTFTDLLGNNHNVISVQRAKKDNASVLKLLREGKKTPGVIDDHHGITLVFEKKEGIEAFFQVIQNKLEFTAAISDIKNSINGEPFNGKSYGSSPKLRVYKCNFMYRGHLIEFQGYLIPDYFDSQYRDGLSWDEYSVTRFCNNDEEGSIKDLLYPQDLYPINWEKTMKRRIREIRKEKRSKATLLGKTKRGL